MAKRKKSSLSPIRKTKIRRKKSTTNNMKSAKYLGNTLGLEKEPGFFYDPDSIPEAGVSFDHDLWGD